MITSIYKVVNETRHHVLDHNPFIHYLDSSNILQIQKNISTNFYFKLRYKVLNDSRLYPLFSEYIPKKKLYKFYIQFLVFNALVKNIRNSKSSHEILTDFLNLLYEIVMDQNIGENAINIPYFIYHFYLVVQVTNF